MGWNILVNNNKWSIFSSVTDSIVEEFDSQQECANFIAKDKIYEAKKKAIETLITFPSGWCINGERILLKNTYELLDDYFDWVKSLYNYGTYDEYYKAIDDKLNELMGI